MGKTMLWTPTNKFLEAPFEKEEDFEQAVVSLSKPMFGESRIYLDVKKKIGVKGKQQNIPDGYLLDLSSKRDPKLYVVENELETHEPIRHITVKIVEFSRAFKNAPQKVKEIVRDCLAKDKNAFAKCADYAQRNGFDNVDLLLELIVHGPNAFNALVIIASIPEVLESSLQSDFNFPVEIVTLERYSSESGEFIYRFEPFLSDISGEKVISSESEVNSVPTVDPSNLDTIVVPAEGDGFEETFLGENRWYQIRIHPTMIPKIKYIAAYRVAPECAITHVAPVKNIERWKDTAKYVLNFSEPAKSIGPIKLVPKPNGLVIAPRGPRYTSFERLKAAKNLDEAF
jgi:hypothetical protein